MTALILALTAGAVVGLVLGALGGGSVLAVPALIYLLGFTPATATTAGLIIVTATSLTALYAHARAGHVRWKAGAAFAAAGILPAAAAGIAAAHVSQTILTVAFARHSRPLRHQNAPARRHRPPQRRRCAAGQGSRGAAPHWAR